MRYLSVLVATNALLLCAVALPSIALANDAMQPSLRDQLERLEKNVTEFTLSNGFRVVMLRREQSPIFSGHIWVKVGGVNELPGITGIAHMLEHMAFKGSKTIGTKDYAREKVLLERLEKLAADAPAGESFLSQPEFVELQKQLQGLWDREAFSRAYKRRGAVGLNAGTGNDYTVYTVDLPNVAFELWCWLESDRLLNPVFRQFYKEREVVKEERRMRTDDNPRGKLYEALLASAFWTHTNRLPTIGWPSDLDNLTATKVRKFYDTYYRPDNMVIGLVGDLDPAVARPMLERYFGRVPAGKGPIPQVTVREEQQKGEREVVVEFDAEPSLMMAYHKPTFPNRDDVAFTLLHELLAGSRSAMLYKSLVQERQIATSVYTTEAPGELFPPVYLVVATPRQGISNRELAVEIQKMLDQLKVKPVGEKELQAAKRRILVSVLGGLASNSGMARMLTKTELLWGDWRTFLEFYQAVLETTAEDIRDVVQRYLNPSNRTIARLETVKSG